VDRGRWGKVGQIGLDCLAQDLAVGVHARLVLRHRDMGRQVAQGERFLRLKAQVLAQPPGALDIAERRLRQLLQVAGLILGERVVSGFEGMPEQWMSPASGSPA
jgi:hypothetical protein